ncbi:LuxR family two component transcriptional regulator (plasmid) [Chondrocystis sp. NIES-4102]|nr:LuxR family two component transcriptional regulator [Chondrocystis sp. NIES-4102]
MRNNQNNERVKVLIVDDQVTIQQALINIFSQLPEIEIIGVASNGQEAIDKTIILKPNIIFMDIVMPVIDGVTASKQILQQFPDIKIVIVASDPINYEQASKIAIKGYIVKGSIPEDYVALIRNIIHYDNLNNTSYKNNIYPLSNYALNSGDNHTSSKKMQNHYINILIIQIIDLWLKNNSANILPENFFEEILKLDENFNFLEKFLLQGESVNCDIIKESELRINKYSSDLLKCISKNDFGLFNRTLSDIEKKIDVWIYKEECIRNHMSCQLRLRINALNLRINLIKKVRDFIKSFWNNTLPQESLNYLENLEQLIANQIYNFHLMLKSYLQYQKSYEKSYEILKAKVLSSEQVNENYDYMIKAFKYMCIYKIKREALELSIEALKSIREISQTSIDTIILTVKLLQEAKIQCKFQLNCQFNDDSNQENILFEQIQAQVIPEKLKYSLEKYLGMELNSWGNCSYITEHRIREFFILELNEIIKNFSVEIMQNL